jgi:multiple sugar transport system permease protein
MAETRTVQPGDRSLAYVTLAPSIALLLLLSVVPTITVFATAMQRVGLGELSGPWVGFDNFAWALESRQFWRALWNTFVWVFGSVAIEMVLGLAIALLLHQSFMGRGVARAILLAPYLVPTIVAVLVWRYMFHDIVGILNAFLMDLGLIDRPLQWLSSTRWAMVSVIVVGVWKFFPFVVLAILGILQSIPQEQYEAARIDGASAFQQFWRITLPYVMPVFILTALLRTIWTFHKFEIIYLLTGGGPLDATTTLPILVYQKGFVDFELGRAAAIAILTFLILAVLIASYFLLMRRAEDRQ